MKKILTIIALALVSSVTFATGHFGGGAISGTDSNALAVAGGASNGNGNGFAAAGTSTGALNTTGVSAFSTPGANNHSTDVGSRVFSAGSTYSVSEGVQNSAGAGVSGGVSAGGSIQGGAGAAFATGGALDSATDATGTGFGIGGAATNNAVIQGSGSFTGVVDNGKGTDLAVGFADSGSVAGVHINALPSAVTINEYSDVAVIAGGGSTSTVSGTAVAGGIGGGAAGGLCGGIPCAASATTFAVQGIVPAP